MIEVDGLTKRFGAATAVDGLSFVVRPGRVTGFLGPNGAGKSTTMRMMIGLDRPTAGRVRINGRVYRDHAAPLCEAGALLDGRSVHKGRTARQHLLGLARTHGLPAARVEAVLERVGLAAVADRRAGGFSLGMAQRLGIAAALLGDPAVVILDEPVNGLDPDGVLWIRTLLKDLAAQGRTVLVSSHLMSEMALTAEHLLIVGAGRLLADESMTDMVGRVRGARCLVRSPRLHELRELLDSHIAQLHNPDSARMVEPHTTQLRESVSARMVEPHTARLGESDSARMVESHTARLGESDSARMVEPHTARLGESDSARMVESHTTQLRESDSARMPKPHIAQMRETDGARRRESDGAQPGGARMRETADGLEVEGVDAAVIGELAAQHGIALHELTTHRPSLENAYMELTRGSVEYGVAA